MILRLLISFTLLIQTVLSATSAKIQSINVNCEEDGMGVDIQFDQAFHGVIFSRNFFSTPGCNYIHNPGQDKVHFTIKAGQCGTVIGPPSLTDASAKRARRDVNATLAHSDPVVLPNGTVVRQGRADMFGMDFGKIDRMLNFGMPGSTGGSMYENSREDSPPPEAMEFMSQNPQQGQPQSQGQQPGGNPDQSAQLADNQVAQFQGGNLPTPNLQVPNAPLVGNLPAAASDRIQQMLNVQANHIQLPIQNVNGLYPTMANPNVPSRLMTFNGAPNPPSPPNPVGSYNLPQGLSIQLPPGAMQQGGNQDYNQYQQNSQSGQNYYQSPYSQIPLSNQYASNAGTPAGAYQVSQHDNNDWYDETNTTLAPVEDAYALPDLQATTLASDAEGPYQRSDSYTNQGQVYSVPGFHAENSYGSAVPNAQYLGAQGRQYDGGNQYAQGVPQVPNMPNYPLAPQGQQAPDMPIVPAYPQVGQQMPVYSSVPNAMQIPNSPGIPSYQGGPQMPEVPQMPIPDGGGFGDGGYGGSGGRYGGGGMLQMPPMPQPPVAPQDGGYGRNIGGYDQQHGGDSGDYGNTNNYGQNSGGYGSGNKNNGGSTNNDNNLNSRDHSDSSASSGQQKVHSKTISNSQQIFSGSNSQSSSGSVIKAASATTTRTVAPTLKVVTTIASSESEEFDSEEETLPTIWSTRRSTTVASRGKPITTAASSVREEFDSEEETLPTTRSTRRLTTVASRAKSTNSAAEDDEDLYVGLTIKSKATAAAKVIPLKNQLPPLRAIIKQEQEGSSSFTSSKESESAKSSSLSKGSSSSSRNSTSSGSQVATGGGSQVATGGGSQVATGGGSQVATGGSISVTSGKNSGGNSYSGGTSNDGEPAFGYNEPKNQYDSKYESGGRDQSAGGQEPSFGYHEPAGQYNEPKFQYNEPADQYREPNFGYKEPAGQFNRDQSTGGQEPAFGYREPAGQFNRDQSAGGQEPAFGYREPAGQFNRDQSAGGQEPSLGYHEPAGQFNTEPKFQYNEPAGRFNQEPQFGYKEPTGQYNRDQSAGGVEPNFGYKEPGFGYNEPSFGYREPQGGLMHENAGGFNQDLSAGPGGRSQSSYRGGAPVSGRAGDNAGNAFSGGQNQQNSYGNGGSLGEYNAGAQNQQSSYSDHGSQGGYGAGNSQQQYGQGNDGSYNNENGNGGYGTDSESSGQQVVVSVSGEKSGGSGSGSGTGQQIGKVISGGTAGGKVVSIGTGSGSVQVGGGASVSVSVSQTGGGNAISVPSKNGGGSVFVAITEKSKGKTAGSLGSGLTSSGSGNGWGNKGWGHQDAAAAPKTADEADGEDTNADDNYGSEVSTVAATTTSTTNVQIEQNKQFQRGSKNSEQTAGGVSQQQTKPVEPAVSVVGGSGNGQGAASIPSRSGQGRGVDQSTQNKQSQGDRTQSSNSRASQTSKKPQGSGNAAGQNQQVSEDDNDQEAQDSAGVMSGVQKGKSNAAQQKQQQSGSNQASTDTSDGGYIENVIVIQNDPLVQEVWDAARAIRCEWRSNYKKTVSTKERIALTEIQTMRFAGDDIEVWMEIQAGKGPWADPVSNIVPIGHTMTLLIGANDPKHEFDLRIGRCIAHDGGKSRIDLTDDNGCVVRDRIMSKFDKAKDWGAEHATIAFAHFSAFKFPETTKVFIECDVEVCKRGCTEMCSSKSSAIKVDVSQNRHVSVNSGSSSSSSSNGGSQNVDLSLPSSSSYGAKQRQRRNVKTDKDTLSVRNHYEAVAPADLSFSIDINVPGQNGTTVYAGVRPNTDQFCMSRGGFGVGLGILLTAIIVASMTSIFLCLRYKNQRPLFVR